jgi:hypothetical protein
VKPFTERRSQCVSNRALFPIQSLGRAP